MKKPLVTLLVIAIVVIALASVGPMVYKAFTDTGTKAGSLDANGAKAASTDINGTWTVIPGSGANATDVGYTIHEILPGKEKDTSGRTSAVTGSLVVKDGKLTSGSVSVDLTKVSSDVEKRDIAVRNTILHTEQFPEATFTVSTPVDVSQLPDNGTEGTVETTGEWTIHGVTKELPVTMNVLRTGNRLIVSGDVPFNRSDFGVDSPEFVAAKIDDAAEMNVLLTLEKK